MPEAKDLVVSEFHHELSRSKDMAVAVAAIKALASVIKRSSASTVMELQAELRAAATLLERCRRNASDGGSISQGSSLGSQRSVLSAMFGLDLRRCACGGHPGSSIARPGTRPVIGRMGLETACG
ncbi:unnamed protein product [Ostreobium quekettii]|uniref:Uncharacterized protein n=1 Tax=Ostreobium quekettii TaxID=121088 RepID=A0A8S1JGD8_9CHLO|nr:unnamed protein product [Ostreobium quekettii]